MIDPKIYYRVSCDSSNSELRELAEEYGVELSDLWRARRRKSRIWRQGVYRAGRKY